MVGPNTIIQAAIPDILNKTPQSWHDEQNQKLASAAEQFFEGLLVAPGLRPIMPSGAMYMMVSLVADESSVTCKYSSSFCTKVNSDYFLSAQLTSSLRGIFLT